MKELEGNSYYGREATYSGAGSVQYLRETKQDTLNILKCVHSFSPVRYNWTT